jgi:predicted dehydrogenase
MNVLIIGLGSIANKHLAALRSLGTFRFFALRSSKSDVAKDDVENCYSWDEVPSGIDFAIIANPTDMHRSAIADCVRRGIPLFIEKPIAHQLGGLDELGEEISSAGLTTYVACNLRFLSSLVFLKNTISGKRVNEVNVYCGSSLPVWRPGTDFRLSYSADASRGGGVHLDLFHELDYVCWIFGMPADSKGIIRSVSSLAIAAPDYAVYHLFYRSFTAAITLNYYRPTPKRAIEILFEDSVWTLDLLQNKITDDKGVVIFEDDVHRIKDTYRDQMAYFLDKLEVEGMIENTFAASLNILKIALSYE